MARADGNLYANSSRTRACNDGFADTYLASDQAAKEVVEEFNYCPPPPRVARCFEREDSLGQSCPVQIRLIEGLEYRLPVKFLASATPRSQQFDPLLCCNCRGLNGGGAKPSSNVLHKRIRRSGDITARRRIEMGTT